MRRLPACPTPAPSYASAVAPVVASRCAGCHYAGSPLAREVFSSYASAYAIRGSILTQLYSCAMPPAGSPLTADEKTTVLEWLECNAPEN